MPSGCDCDSDCDHNNTISHICSFNRAIFRLLVGRTHCDYLRTALPFAIINLAELERCWFYANYGLLSQIYTPFGCKLFSPQNTCECKAITNMRYVCSRIVIFESCSNFNQFPGISSSFEVASDPAAGFVFLFSCNYFIN